MDIQKIVDSLAGCECGKVHDSKLRHVEIGEDVTARSGKILTDAGFTGRFLIVTDKNEWAAAKGLAESLDAAGFEYKLHIYDDMRYALVEYSREVEALSEGYDGVLSVGTGSVNDICRYACGNTGKKFAIYATAPSMDGFASDTAPIIENEFKTTRPATQPSVILADTKVIAASPTELKSAGFGDIAAKYIGLFEWKLVNMLTGEHYCPRVAALTRSALEGTIALADGVTGNDTATAGKIMEALVMSGISMQLAETSRPASGAEHATSHYIGCYKLARGVWPEFHGKKVGVATVMINRIYHNLADRVEKIDPARIPLDEAGLAGAYTEIQLREVLKLNRPPVADIVDPEVLKEKWQDVRELIYNELPSDKELCDVMTRAGVPITPAGIGVDDELMTEALRWHPYMRRRVMLTHLFPVMKLDIADFIK